MMRKWEAPKLPPEGRFHYHQGVFLSGMYKSYELCKEEKYFDYIKSWVDAVITEDEIGSLEKAIDRMQETLPPLEKFILPGGHPAVSLAHVARSICRRAERRTVTLKGTGAAGLETAEKYLNRLSDYLFVSARAIAQDCGIEERTWEYPGSK